MPLNLALTELRNICINSNNQQVIEQVSEFVDPDKNLHDQATVVGRIIETIKQQVVYNKEEVIQAFLEINTSSYKFDKVATDCCLSAICKFKSKSYNIKLLYPTSRYVLGDGPWKVIPNTSSEQSYKESRKIANYLNSHFPYKTVELDLQNYLVT